MHGRGGGRHVRKSWKENWTAAMLTAVLIVLGINSVTVHAAAQEDALKNLVLIAGKNSDSTIYSTGILIDAGNCSFIIASEVIDWSEYQCVGVCAASDPQNEMSLEFAASDQGAALFIADRNYGGFSENEILNSEDLSEGDDILSCVYTVDDNGIQIISKENYIEGFHNDKDAVYVETKDEFEITDFGGMVLAETGRLAGIAVPITLKESPCLFLTMDVFFKTEEDSKVEESDSGGSEDTDSKGREENDQAPEGEQKRPEKSGNSNGTPNLLKDSYFMRIALIVLAAMAVSLYVYTNRKARNGGKTVYLEDHPSAGHSSAGIMLIGSGGYFQGRVFDISTTPVIFGRNPALCTAVYPKDTKGISSLHCRIEVTDGKILLTDLESSYGTFLEDGRQLPANAPCELQRGNRFYLADRVNMFQIQ